MFADGPGQQHGGRHVHGQQLLELALERPAACLASERVRAGSAYREELERLRDDVSRQMAAEIKNLRANTSAREVVTTLTKPIERAIDFIATEQREVRVGDKAEHRKFKVRGDVVSIDRTKAVLNVSGKKMTVDVKELVPLSGAAASQAAGGLRARRSIDQEAVWQISNTTSSSSAAARADMSPGFAPDSSA